MICTGSVHACAYCIWCDLQVIIMKKKLLLLQSQEDLQAISVMYLSSVCNCDGEVTE